MKHDLNCITIVMFYECQMNTLHVSDLRYIESPHPHCRNVKLTLQVKKALNCDNIHK